MASQPSNYLGAVGIGVSDLRRSVDFYGRVCGMRQLMRLTLPDMEEVVVGYGNGQSALALMHWTDGSDRTYTDLPVKVVIYAAEPKVLADAIRAEGLDITREPEAVPELGNVVVGFAKDPDGYVIEILEAGQRQS
jgi:lactoylglutathione lyase